MRTRYAPTVAEMSRSRFRFGRAALAAWGRHVERFGLETTVTNLKPFGPPVRSVAEWYVASAATLYSAVVDEERDDRPRDVGATELATWNAEVARELAVRWLALGDRPEVAQFTHDIIAYVPPANFEASPVAFAAERLRALRIAWQKAPPPPPRPFPSPILGVDRAAIIRLCQDAGEPSVAEQLFALQTAAASAPAAPTAVPTGVNTGANAVPVPLPRAEILDEPGDGGDATAREAWFDGGQISYALPLAEPEPEYLPFPASKLERVSALAVVDDQPWFLATGAEEVAVAATDAQLNRDVKAPTATFTRLWTVRSAAEGLRAERVPGTVGTNDFYTLSRSDEHGLHLRDNHGVAGFFLPRDQSWRLLPQALPPTPPTILTNVHVSPDLFQEVPGGWWVGGTSGLAWCSTNGSAWDDFYEPSLGVSTSQWGPMPRGVRKPRRDDRQTLHLLHDLAERLQRREHAPRQPGRLPGRVVTLAPDGEFLWLVTDAFSPGTPVSQLLVLHVPSRRWVTSVVVPARVRAMDVTRTHVWLGLEASPYKGGGSPLWRYSKAPLLAVPEDRWQPQAVGGAEASAALAGLSPEQRAVHALFHGDPRPFVELHRDEAPADLSVEDLFLLALALDSHGLNEPERLAKLARLLDREHPASPFARLARRQWPKVLREPVADASVAAHVERLMSRFDADHDGALNEGEFGFLLFEEEDSLGNLLAPVARLAPAVPANHLYHQIHHSDSRGIAAADLTAALSASGRSPFPRRNPAVRP